MNDGPRGPALPGLSWLARLSSGGMGEVWLAQKTGAHGFTKLLAVKLIRGELSARADVRAMFLDEARLVAQLEHPAIAQVFDFGELDGQLYLTMEYVAGVPLAGLAEAATEALPPGVAARLVAEVLRGLHAAHERVDRRGQALGVVHRDVSPQNVILSFEGRPKILDFGIALFRERLAPATELDAIKGKLPYLAPEQLLRGPLDRRADLYGAAAVLYELIVGAPLFPGHQLLELATQIATADPEYGEVWRPIPELAALVQKGLAKDPERRFPTARAMAEALEDWAQRQHAPALESWAEGALRSARAAHQQQLARWTGEAPARRPEPAVARRVTLIDEVVSAPSLRAPPPPAPAVDPRPTPGAAARRAGVAASLGALLLVGVGSWWSSQDPPSALAPATVDAGPASTTLAPEPTPTPVDRSPDPPPPPPVAASKPTERTPRRTTAVPAVATPPAAQAILSIGARPYGLVRLDGQALGATPIIELPVPAGRHQLELLDASDGTVRRAETIELQPGERRQLNLTP